MEVLNGSTRTLLKEIETEYLHELHLSEAEALEEVDDVEITDYH